MAITFGFPLLLVSCIAALMVAALWRWYKHRDVQYQFSSVTPFFVLSGSGLRYKMVPFVLRLFTLMLMALALGDPRIPDEHSVIPVEGIDIMLVLDVSGSMQYSDDPDQMQSKFDIAKREAIAFIKKRVHDQIGIVLFALGALVRAPLTYDKEIVSDILRHAQVGVLVDPRGTQIGAALLAALNKLKDSTAQSKIAILLTDGNSSDEPRTTHLALELAKKLDVKIYTIGIGQEAPSQLHAMLYRDSYLHVELLKRIANETGGQFFLARHADELETIYATIDQLEKTEHHEPEYMRYFYFWPWLLMAAMVCFLGELLITHWWWIRI